MSHARNERNGVVTLAVTRLIHRPWSQPKAFSGPACETHHYPFGKKPCLKCPNSPTSQNHLSASMSQMSQPTTGQRPLPSPVSQMSQPTNRTKPSAQSHVANVPTHLSHSSDQNITYIRSVANVPINQPDKDLCPVPCRKCPNLPEPHQQEQRPAQGTSVT